MDTAIAKLTAQLAGAPPLRGGGHLPVVVKTLRDSLEAEDIAAARPLLRDLIGPITALPTESGGERYLTAHFPAFEAEARLVAGARFGNSLQPGVCLLTIPRACCPS
jgi:hypothetical protein